MAGFPVKKSSLSVKNPEIAFAPGSGVRQVGGCVSFDINAR